MTTTIAFVFGILAMIGIALVVAVIVGLVKAIKTEKNLKAFKTLVGEIGDNDRQYVYKVEGEIIHKIDTLEEDVRRDIGTLSNETTLRIDDLDKDSCYELEKVKSNFDSRIDKLSDKIFNKNSNCISVTAFKIERLDEIINTAEYTDKHKLELLKIEINKIIN